MKRTESQNKRIYSLLSLSRDLQAEKERLCLLYSNGRTTHTSELSETEADALLEYMQDFVNTLNRSRRRIFSRIRQIKLMHASDPLPEAEVLRYIANIIGLDVPKVDRLNDYTKSELWRINRKLDAIKPKAIIYNRKKMKKL